MIGRLSGCLHILLSMVGACVNCEHAASGVRVHGFSRTGTTGPQDMYLTLSIVHRCFQNDRPLSFLLVLSGGAAAEPRGSVLN